jgi:hypothetical protein
MHMTGDLYAAILFSNVEIPPETADRFRNIALDLKLAIAPFRDDAVFGVRAPAAPDAAEADAVPA